MRAEELVGDILLLLEHPPVITLGRHADPGHVLLSPQMLARKGLEVWRVERGGGVTYHGPGQLVGYVILGLRAMGIGVRRFVWALEEALLRTIGGCGVRAQRQEGALGVWAGPAKLAAIGIRVRRGIAYHGFALNVAPDMEPFQFIVPCGQDGGQVTSLAQLLGGEPDHIQIRRKLAQELAELLHLDLVPLSLEELGEHCSIAERPLVF
jgi:lipoyl(octanoyl) transferase